MKELSIIIPVYNEIKTILKIINKINRLKNITKQIIVVDDCSSDGSREILLKNKNKIDLLLLHKKNQGKGGAIRTAQRHIKGKYTIIQDADLEYNPIDYQLLLKVIRLKKCYVVYGSRVLNKKRYQLNNFTSASRIFFNHMLTILSNLLNNQKLTDAHTCFKMFESKLFKSIMLKEYGFAFCPEITTKISNLYVDITEVPISYEGRTFEEGKKISFLDGVRAIYALFKYKIFK
jgi:dolichol-phosphate mannosyltransferase